MLRTWPMRALGWWLYELQQGGEARGARRLQTPVLRFAGGVLSGSSEEVVRLAPRDRVHIVLPPEETLTVRFRVPLALYPRLPGLLALRAAAAWPVADTPPVWDAAVQRQGRHLDVALTLARADTAAAARTAAADLGGRPERVSVGSEVDERLVLVETAAGGQAGTGVRRSILRAVSMVYAALAVAAGLAIGADWRADANLRQTLAEARAAARPALEARASLLARTALADALAAQVADRPRAARLLSALFGRLPAGTVLREVDLLGPGAEQPGLEIAGTVANPAVLLERAAGVDGLTEASLTGPVVRAPTGGFRFEARFGLARADGGRP